MIKEKLAKKKECAPRGATQGKQSLQEGVLCPDDSLESKMYATAKEDSELDG